MTCVLIIGVNGQDGTYLTELLLKKNYIVHGIVRQRSQYLTNPILQNQINNNKVNIHEIDVLEIDHLRKLILDIKPNEIYYLATTHELKISKKNYNEVMSINISGLINILEMPLAYPIRAVSSRSFTLKTSESTNSLMLMASLHVSFK